MKMTIIKTFLASLVIGAGVTGVTGVAVASEGGVELPEGNWTFDGPFGKFDRQAAQRGFQVYREVCSSCHGLQYIAFRNLTEIGFSEGQVKALAAEYDVADIDDQGEEITRPGIAADYLVSPFANELQAAAANGGKAPPDLSLMVRARANGANYVNALLGEGYVDAPADFDLDEALSYNAYFSGHQIAMAAPLFDDLVEYTDGTTATTEQMASDVVNFLAWTADPKMESRKWLGLIVMSFMFVATILAWLSNKKVWRDVKGK